MPNLPEELLTEWFPAHVFPVRRGIYEINPEDRRSRLQSESQGRTFTIWTGEGWGFKGDYDYISQQFLSNPDRFSISGLALYRWRGLKAPLER